MQVIGSATQQYVYAASRRRKFRINEILVVEDPAHGLVRCEVIATETINRFMPMVSGRESLVDERVKEMLQAVGFDLAQEVVNIGRLRLLDEVAFPVEVGSPARLPRFAEVEDLLLQCRPAEGLLLGTIRGTEEIFPDLPREYKEVLCLFAGGKVQPQDALPFVFDHRSLREYPHAGIFGGSGSGKSFALRVILEEFMRRRIPTVVFDPHQELDFTRAFSGLPENFQYDFRPFFQVCWIGSDVGIEFARLSTAELVVLLRAAGGSLSEPMENIVYTLHRFRESLPVFSRRLDDLVEALEMGEQELTRQMKPDLEASQRQKLENLKQLLDAYKNRVGPISSLKGVQWRLHRIKQQGLFQHGVEPVKEALLQRKTVIVRGPNIWALQMFAAYLTKLFYNQRRSYVDRVPQASRFVPFVLATDEAHIFAPKVLETAPAKPLFREIAQEGRKYGVFLILATQRPALLDDTITAQLHTKLIFRTVRRPDLETVREETDIGGEEIQRLPYLPSGNCFLSSAAAGRSVPVRIRAALTASPHSTDPFAELEEFADAESKEFLKAVEDFLPLRETDLNHHLPELSKKFGRPLSYKKARDILRELQQQGHLLYDGGPFGAYRRSQP